MIQEYLIPLLFSKRKDIIEIGKFEQSDNDIKKCSIESNSVKTNSNKIINKLYRNQTERPKDHQYLNVQYPSSNVSFLLSLIC